MSGDIMTDGEIDLSGDGGVTKRILVEGSGEELPSDGCKVSLHYTGKLVDGNVFDSSLDRNEPFEFVLGKGGVIRAFNVGVSTMKKGEKCVLTCSPKYAYGAAGSPPTIPPNSTLLFELEMLSWKGEDISPNSDGSIERIILKKSAKRKTPNEGAHVKVHIIGRYEANVFDDREVEFDVGEGVERGIVEGIEIAILKISVGETARLTIAPKYAFGIEGNPDFGIPPKVKVEYTVTLIECERAIDEWKLDNEESIVQAKLFKEKGTKYLKNDKYKLALKMYNKSNNYLSNCDNEESKQLRLAIQLNIALCNQKMDDPYEAKIACNAALEIDPKNIKALYRRGLCHFALNNFEKALGDFKYAQELDPQNKATLNQIIRCRQKIKECHEQEKKIYANMFSKFAAADKQKENNDREDEPDVLESCGEWTEEEARKEADKAFERDNNIFMLN